MLQIDFDEDESRMGSVLSGLIVILEYFTRRFGTFEILNLLTEWHYYNIRLLTIMQRK